MFPQFSFADFNQFVADQDSGRCAGTSADSGKIAYEPYGTIQSKPHYIAEKFIETSFAIIPDRQLICSVWRSHIDDSSCTMNIPTPDGSSFKPDYMFRERRLRTPPFFIVEVFRKNGTLEGNRNKLRESLHRFEGEIRGGVFFYYGRKKQCWWGEVWRYVNLRATKEVNHPDVLEDIDGWDEQENIEVQVCDVSPNNPAEQIGDDSSYLQENRPYKVWSMQGDAEDLLLTMADLLNDHYDEIVVNPNFRKPNATSWVLALDIAD